MPLQLRERRRYFDLADNSGVEGTEIFGGNPVFLVSLAASQLDLVSIKKVFRYFKACNESGAAGGHVPVSCDLGRIRFRSDRIEDRLLRQTRRKSAHAALLD